LYLFEKMSWLRINSLSYLDEGGKWVTKHNQSI
jgi:hypothetical protein